MGRPTNRPDETSGALRRRVIRTEKMIFERFHIGSNAMWRDAELFESLFVSINQRAKICFAFFDAILESFVSLDVNVAEIMHAPLDREWYEFARLMRALALHAVEQSRIRMV